MKLYNIFGWSKWSDVLTFHFGNQYYLLQGKKHKNGKTRFRQVSMRYARPITDETLKQAGLWKQISL